MTVVASAVEPPVRATVPAALKNVTVGAVGVVGVVTAVRVTVATAWLVFVPVPAFTVSVLAPVVSGTAGNVNAPAASDVVVAPVSTMVTGVVAEVVPFTVAVVSVVVPFTKAVVPVELNSDSTGVVGAVELVRVTVATAWLVFVPVPAFTVNVLAPTTTGTAGNVNAPVASDVVVAPVWTMVTAVVGEVVPFTVAVVSVVVPFTRAVVPVELNSDSTGVVGAVELVRVTVATAWLVFVPVPAFTVNVLAPTTTGTAGNVNAPLASDVAVAPVSTMVTAVLADVVPLTVAVVSVVAPFTRAVVPVELNNDRVGVVGVVAAERVMVATA